MKPCTRKCPPRPTGVRVATASISIVNGRYVTNVSLPGETGGPALTRDSCSEEAAIEFALNLGVSGRQIIKRYEE